MKNDQNPEPVSKSKIIFSLLIICGLLLVLITAHSAVTGNISIIERVVTLVANVLAAILGWAIGRGQGGAQ